MGGLSLQIIPVIDLMGGIVVHARQGQRRNYKAIDSVLCQSSEPEEFVAELLDFYPFKTIYLADLDAITLGVLNIDLYSALIEAFPKVEFCIDAGVKTVVQWQALKTIGRLNVILASECLQDLSLLTEADILSLDFKNGDLLGNDRLLQQSALWPEKIIVLSLDNVGSQNGPDIKQMKQIKQLAQGKHSFILGGGVRDERDLAMLKEKNAGGVLVASAFHNGKIDKGILSRYQ